MQAVVLAGGKGTRLKPFTNAIPKPLVPVGDRAVLEILIHQLKDQGVTEVILAVNHLAHLIQAVFGDGERFGLKIRYSLEDKALGTAAPISLIEDLDEEFLVMNGDLLTSLSFDRLVTAHRAGEAEITVGTFKKSLQLELGVLGVENRKVVSYTEKPTRDYLVSMGIYCFNRSVLQQIPVDERFDLPDLINRLISQNIPVGSYAEDCLWLDIGTINDYEKAIKIVESNPEIFGGEQ